MSVRVLLVDDHQVVREGLRALLEEHHGLAVVGEAGDGRTAVELTSSLRPDVVVMDLALPVLGGVEAIRQIHATKPATRVLVLSMYSDPRMVREALFAGAHGYVVKDEAFGELARAIRAILAGDRYLSPRIDADEVGLVRPGEGGIGALTGRERQVLALIAGGRSTRDIARTLDISVKTVETHRRNLTQKLELYSVAELTKLAVREGLTPLDDGAVAPSIQGTGD